MRRNNGKNINKLDQIIEKAQSKFDDNLKANIKNLDQKMEERLGQFEGIVSRSLVQVDEVLAKNLDRLDEITEKRVGNLDIIATKASLTFEDSLTRFIGAACLLIFAACAMWRLYEVGYRTWVTFPPGASWWATFQLWLPLTYRRLLAQLGGAAICLAVLFALFKLIPSKSSDRNRYDSGDTRSLIPSKH